MTACVLDPPLVSCCRQCPPIKQPPPPARADPWPTPHPDMLLPRPLRAVPSNRSTPAVSRSPVAAGLEGQTSGRGRGRAAGRLEATARVLNPELQPPPPASRPARKDNRDAATEQARSKQRLGLGARSAPSKADRTTTLALASASVSQAAPSRRGGRVMAVQVRARESHGMGMLPESLLPTV